jgi:hypothetical protein
LLKIACGKARTNSDESGGRCISTRETRLYPGHIYGAVVLFNLCGRISWSLAISPHFCQHACRVVVGLVEIIRRGVWIVFRLEFACTESPAALFGVFDSSELKSDSQELSLTSPSSY